nr:restriction endonuclease subunit S [Mycolicibacterium komanii]CRL77970.1 restriction modification system DNA specificity domain-containing protein [Mycolicibacterium komanii]
MSWPPYREYQSTEVPGVGPVPADWTVTRMDKHLRYEKRQVSTELMAGEEVFHYSIPLVQTTGTGEVQDGNSIDSNKLKIDREVVLISKLNPRKATVCRAEPQDRLTVCSTEFVPLTVQGMDSKFLYYVVTSDPYRQRLESMVESVTRSHQRVAPANIYRFWWAIPPRAVQRQIVSFLERETAKIDALVAKQEQLIATLREDRTATITHAVTKGLDPEAEMRASGVEWLGDIPLHWKHSFVKFACATLPGYAFKSESFTNDPADIRLLRGANVGVDRIDWTDVVRWPHCEAAAFAAYELEQGDIVMGLDRPFIGAGIRVSRIGADDIPSLLLQRVLRLRAVDPFDQDYLFYLLTGPGIVHHLTPMFTGVSVPHVSPDQVGSFPLPQPPKTEQRQIVTHLKKRCTQIDELIGKAKESVEILGEYRSGLITDAVTGKIDVRRAV